MSDPTQPPAPATTAEPDRPLTTAEILWWERFELRPPRRPTLAEQCTLSEAEFAETAPGERMAALCLSGGGIRSAAFSLGVVQALASKKLLTGFDYLSTVSGGGYLGSFLQRWILGNAADGRNEAQVERLLGASLKRKTAPIDQLREGANFITPKLGLMSSDTWTAIATSLRNVSVNWTLFIPMILIVATIPPLFYWLLMAVGATEVRVALALHWIAATWAMTGVFLGLPSNRVTGYWTPGQIRRHILLPALIAMITMLVIAAGPPADQGWLDWLPEEKRMLAVAAGFVGVPLASFLVAQIIASPEVRLRLFYDLLLWLVCGLAGGALLYVVADRAIAGGVLMLTEGGLAGAELLVIFGPALYVACLLAAGWVFSVLRTAGRHDAALENNAALRPDLDREWLVRISGELIRPVLFWSLLALICLVLTYFDPETGAVRFGANERVLMLDNWKSQLWLALGGVVSGLAGAFAGKSGSTWFGYVTKLLSLEVIALIATAIFAIVAMLTASHVVSDATMLMNAMCERGGRCPWDPVWWMFGAHAALIAGLLAFLWAWGRFVDVNRFSLNGFYRYRLSRAFLGAARAGNGEEEEGCKPDVRKPDPFTGIDPADNVRMHTLWPDYRKHSAPCLFPVVNVALNASATKKLVWQERKALPFVMTPLACGSGWLGEDAAGAYIDSKRFGGKEQDEALEGAGVTLAAAMAISGAAASPNMGYHSSPATAFLMTLFNVRLGAWMPNPALWKRADPRNVAERPRNGVMPLLRELGGNTDEKSADVYLSDGGHFENLGVYEMLRRRCAAIFAVDAGCDPALTFEDLSNAARKAAIDLYVELRFSEIKLASRDKMTGDSIAYAVAEIKYPEGWSGRLVYLKPSLIEPLPIDVRAYAASSQSFPHESTVDQWYTESQFESYRSLGATLCRTLGRDTYESVGGPRERIQAFFEDILLSHQTALAPRR